MKERTIAMLWALGVFAIFLISEYLQLDRIVITTIAGLAGVVIGYFFARDANGTNSTSP